MPLFVGSLLPGTEERMSIPEDFLEAQSVVVEMTSRNVWPRRSWGDDVVELDLSERLVNFTSGLHGPTAESGFQGRCPSLPIPIENEIKEKIAASEIVHFRDLLQASFDITYRWKNHTLDSEPIYQFRWVHRTFNEVGLNTGCYESGEYRIYSADDRNWSDFRPMQVIMCVTRVKLCNTRRRISPSQSVFVGPLPG
jgi:hypothetical protein